MSSAGLLLLLAGVGSGRYFGKECLVKRYFSGRGEGSFLKPDPNMRKKLGSLSSLKQGEHSRDAHAQPGNNRIEFCHLTHNLCTRATT